MTYVAIITMMFTSYEDTLIAGLAKKNYTLSVGSKNGKFSISSASRAGVICSIILTLNMENYDAEKVLKDVTDVLDNKKLLYYSIVVLEHTNADCRWQLGNIKLPEEPPLPTKPGIKDSDLN